MVAPVSSVPWRVRLTLPKPDWEAMEYDSACFDRCYTGECKAAGAKFATVHSSDWIPKDLILKELAFDFNEAVATRNADRALKVADAIDAIVDKEGGYK